MSVFDRFLNSIKLNDDDDLDDEEYFDEEDDSDEYHSQTSPGND